MQTQDSVAVLTVAELLSLSRCENMKSIRATFYMDRFVFKIFGCLRTCKSISLFPLVCDSVCALLNLVNCHLLCQFLLDNVELFEEYCKWACDILFCSGHFICINYN